MIKIQILIILFSFCSSVYAGQLAEEAIARGQQYLGRGMYQEAIEEFSDAISSDPFSSQAYYNRARAYYSDQKLERAISDFSRAIELDSENAQIYYERGVAYYYRDDLDRAIADWNSSIKLCPNCVEVYNKRAFAYYKKEQYHKAWEDVHRLQELGFHPSEQFLQDLRRYSGRDE